MARDVFICHASQDRSVANAICSLLESKGLTCWIAPRDVPAGKWGGAIMEAVSQSRIMVLIFSANSDISANCLSEVHAAFSKRNIIIPLLIDKTTPSGEMEYYLQTYHWLDASTPPLEKHLNKLADTVKGMLAEIDAKATAAQKKAEIEAEAARAKQKAEEALKEKERQEAEATRVRKEREEAVKAIKAEKVDKALSKAKLETEVAGLALEAVKPHKARTTWIWSGAGTLAVVAVGIILLFTRPWAGDGTIPPPTTTPISGISANTTTPTPTTTPPMTTMASAPKTTAPPATTIPPTTTPLPTTTLPATTAAATVPTGTITIAVTDFGYESTDPIYYESQWGWCMYDQLISWDENGNYTGAIAESWSVSPDGNTWTFHIRQGIKFHNGDPLTAEDVKFSVDRFGSDESTNPWSYYLNLKYNKVSSRVVDDYTFEYVTDHPEPALKIPFAWTRILPKTYFEKVGQDAFRETPVGSGPWKFVEHTPETSFKMEANTDYWGQVPAFKYVEFIQVPEESTQVAMLERGEVDLVTVNMDRLVALQKAGWKTIELGYPNLFNISFQGTWLEKAGPTHDIRVRQAMSFAIDRQQLCDTYFHGNADPTLGEWFIQPGAYGWTDALRNDVFDLAKAKALLAQANYPAAYADPSIHIYTTAASLDLTLLLQAYWKEAGLQVVIEVVDSMVNGTYFFNFQRITGEEPNTGWIFPWYYGTVVNSIYHCSNMYCTWGAHNTANDPHADELYTAATSELDEAKAVQLWGEFRVYAKKMYVNVGICGVKPLMVVGSNLGEFTGKNWISLYDALAGIQHK